MRTVSRCRPNTRETSRMLIPSTITARRTRRYTSTWYIHPTTHKHAFEPMDGRGRYIFQPPQCQAVNPSRWSTLPPPFTDVLCTPVRETPNGQEHCLWPDCAQKGNRQYCEYIEEPCRECQLLELGPTQTEGKRFAESRDETDYEMSVTLPLPDFSFEQETD